MSNIVLFSQYIIGDSKSYKIYYGIYNNDLIDAPLIFTDAHAPIIDINIPVFSTFYIRQHFFDKLILTSFADYKYLPIDLQKRTIVIYDKDNDDIDSIEHKLFSIEQNSDYISIIKDKILWNMSNYRTQKNLKL